MRRNQILVSIFNFTPKTKSLIFRENLGLLMLLKKCLQFSFYYIKLSV